MNTHTSDVLFTLEERSREIRNYLDFVQTLINEKVTNLAVITSEDIPHIINYEIEKSLIRTLSATAYLLIYNLIESVMTEALDSVHCALHNNDLSFNELNEKIQKICLKNAQKNLTNADIIDLNGNPTSIEKALIWLGYNKKEHFSGNIDAAKIRDKAKAYGFDIVNHDMQRSQSGRSLKLVRDKRNDLAHGTISFEDCGRDAAIEELIQIHEQTITYLRAVVDGIEIFLANKLYIKSLNMS